MFLILISFINNCFKNSFENGKLIALNLGNFEFFNSNAKMYLFKFFYYNRKRVAKNVLMKINKEF